MGSIEKSLNADKLNLIAFSIFSMRFMFLNGILRRLRGSYALDLDSIYSLFNSKSMSAPPLILIISFSIGIARMNDIMGLSLGARDSPFLSK